MAIQTLAAIVFRASVEPQALTSEVPPVSVAAVGGPDANF
tara:strand:- start:755 stop:874 length:120 start_codon:yes stop_codon:yes gene_type:complete